MTLDELIDRLLQIRRETPAAGSALVIGFVDRLEYRQGQLWLDDFDPHDCEVIEMECPPDEPKPPREKVH